ncbi:hypothetical protein FACS189447_07950 [Spirochaetia bacterium]|nr:hypothetical protein FACS189447_07950 [Spirochaetia bacterium]
MNKINILLNNLDNVEIIRNQIAAILQIETENQLALAENAAIEDLRDFKIGVYVEKARPWELTGSTEATSPFPLINVLLNDVKQDMNPGSPVNEKKYIATFFIDCYGCGNIGSDGNDDTLATIRAWKTARIVRNILNSGFYTYLGLRGTVRKREITEIKTGAPSNMPESALAITTCRVSFTVDYSEKSPQAGGEIFDGMMFKSLTESGVILIDI